MALLGGLSNRSNYILLGGAKDHAPSQVYVCYAIVNYHLFIWFYVTSPLKSKIF